MEISDISTYKDLVDFLYEKGDFHKLYTRENRIWYIEKIIKYLALTSSSSASDLQLKAPEALKIISDSRKIIKDEENGGFVPPRGQITANSNKGKLSAKTLRRRNLSRRIQIIYGVIASNPRLISDPALRGYLSFCIERRYRSLIRMDYYVNPNWQGYFRYPKECPTDKTWRVNEDATAYWESTDLTEMAWEYKLKPIDGKTYPVEGLKKIFERAKKDPCKGNLFDCSTAMSIVLMDSLMTNLEQSDQKTFMEFLASIYPYYLAIYNFSFPLNAGIEITVFLDEGLFRFESVLISDLQVGDAVYIYNHPLYLTFEPDGAWRGEFALVYDLGNRDIKTNSGIIFGGHGREGTIYSFYSYFLEELNCHISREAAKLQIYLDYKETAGASLPPTSTVNKSENQTIYWEKKQYDVDDTYSCNIYKFTNIAIEYDFFDEKRRKVVRKSDNSFHIIHIRGDDGSESYRIAIDNGLEDNEVKHGAKLKAPVFFRLTDDIEEALTTITDPATLPIYKPFSWCISYYNEATRVYEKRELYTVDGTTIKPNFLKFDDLLESPFLSETPGSNEIKALRVPAEVTPAVLHDLKSNKGVK